MVDSISNSAGKGALTSLLRTQQTATVNLKSNQQIAQAVINRSATSAPAGKTIALASAKNSPPPNLPRGSIVDKLV